MRKRRASLPQVKAVGREAYYYLIHQSIIKAHQFLK
jgi:hypothetical protein